MRRSFMRRMLLAGGLGGGGVPYLHTYFVRKTGNDTTGDGTSAAPWLTLSKALTVAGARDRVLVGDGTYQENTSATGYWYLNNLNPADWLTLEAESGAAGNVIVQGSTSTVYNVRINASSHIRFKWLKFISRVDTCRYCVELRQSAISNLDFQNCTFTILAVAGFTNVCVIGTPLTTIAYANLSFTGCAFNQVGLDQADGLSLYRGAAGDSITNVSVSGCAFNLVRRCLNFNGVTGAAVSSINALSSVGQAVILGVDGATGYATSGSISGGTIQSTNSHALLIGAGANGVTVANNVTVLGGDQGLVLKECQNVTVEDSDITGGSANACYYKAAVGSIVRRCSIHAAQGALIKVGINSDSGNRCQNVTFTNNQVVGSGTASLLDWQDSVGDVGGGVCDYNAYTPGGSGGWGAVRGSAVTNLASQQAAWAGYGDGSNDSHSTAV
jgi:hypothetical protein